MEWSPDGVKTMADEIYARLVSFTTGEANKVVRNSGPDELQASRRLCAEYDWLCGACEDTRKGMSSIPGTYIVDDSFFAPMILLVERAAFT